MSRARDIADAGVKVNYLDNVGADINTTYAPLASPSFTGTVDLTGTTVSLDDDEISGDKVSGGTIGAGTFSGSLTGSTFPAGHVIQTVHEFGETATTITSSTYSSPTYGNITATIIPSSSTNKLFIFGYVTLRMSASGDVGYILVITKTVGASTSDIYSSADIDGNAVDDTTSFVYTALDDVLVHRAPFSLLVTSGTTDPYQVKLHFAKYNGSGTLNVNNSNSHSVITIQEIQT